MWRLQKMFNEIVILIIHDAYQQLMCILIQLRRPSHGNARTCCMEINIAVSLGTDRTPQASIISSNINIPNLQLFAQRQVLKVFVSYMILDFQTPSNTAQLRTDGIIHRSTITKINHFSQ